MKNVIFAILAVVYINPTNTHAEQFGFFVQEYPIASVSRSTENLDKVPELILVGTVIRKNSSSEAIVESKVGTRILQVNQIVDGWKVTEIKNRNLKMSKKNKFINYRFNGSSSGPIEEEILKNSVQEREEGKRLSAIARMQNPEFARKVLKYKNGRPDWEIEYPMGLDDKGITKLSESMFEIDRTKIINGFNDENYLNHIKIENKDGQITISEVIPGSLIDKLGLKEGDSIQSINHTPINNAFNPINLYEIVKQQDIIDVEVIHGNQNTMIQLILAGEMN